MLCIPILRETRQCTTFTDETPKTSAQPLPEVERGTREAIGRPVQRLVRRLSIAYALSDAGAFAQNIGMISDPLVTIFVKVVL
jgi:hypothetical protein